MNYKLSVDVPLKCATNTHSTGSIPSITQFHPSEKNRRIFTEALNGIKQIFKLFILITNLLSSVKVTLELTTSLP